MDEALLAEVAKSPEVDSLTRYQLQQFSQRRRRLELHAQFVKLILYLDRGRDHEQGQFSAEQSDYTSLHALLNNNAFSALVLLGRPGNGKTTLLRHLEMTLCAEGLHDASGAVPIPFFRQLNTFPPQEADSTDPFQWLCEQWQQDYPAMPPLPELMRQRPVVLLLDALNEMALPREQHSEKMAQWRQMLHTLRDHYPETRVLFSCRTADFGGMLAVDDNLPVPQIRFADLSDTVIKEYLQKHLPTHPIRHRKYPLHLHRE